jgi:hypothetical protein
MKAPRQAATKGRQLVVVVSGACIWVMSTTIGAGYRYQPGSSLVLLIFDVG